MILKRRLWAKFVVDLVLWVSATPLAFLIRLEGAVGTYRSSILALVVIGILAKGGIIYASGFHRRSWQDTAFGDIWMLVRGVVLVTLCYSALAFFLADSISIPRSVPLIEGMLALLGLGSVRLVKRLYYEQKWRFIREPGGRAQKVIIIGAGEAGLSLAREMLRHPEARRKPIGFLDDNPGKQRQRFLGLPVFGGIDDLAEVVARRSVAEVLIAMPSTGGEVVRRIVREAQRARVKHRIIPSIPALINGDVSMAQIREVNVEDLLRREAVRLDVAGIKGYLAGRTILVTGAGGSIGSEIVRQVARFNPKNVVLLGRGEGSIFKIDQACRQGWKDINWWPIVADVRDRGKMEYVFKRFDPQVVFHAAANKHVPLMEANPDEAILNNVLGTKNMVELTLAAGTERFVNISTDKAVRPASVMGASKRVAEYLVEWGGRQARPGRSFASVRFGNVLGSSGSVIPLFKRQIEQGGPVTVTHPDVSRYFMTIPEAVQLVLQAGALGGNGTIYVLNMGSPVKIVDLARDLIHLYGLEPGVDIGITYTGLRPGEKLTEELLTDEEGTSVTRFEKIFVAHARGLADERLEALLDELFVAAYSRDDAYMVEVLRELIPTHMLAPRPSGPTPALVTPE